MFLRISSALGLLVAVAACRAESGAPSSGEQSSGDQPGTAIDCAIGSVAELSPVCALEQVAETGEIVIHHPDGGFRRLARDPATGELAPLDGAEPLVPEAHDGGAIRFAVGADRYSIPADLLSPPRE